MTNADKKEIAEIVAAAVQKAMENHCPIGVREETARELIAFAQTWKACRKAMITGIVTTAIGGLLLALWAGAKSLLK